MMATVEASGHAAMRRRLLARAGGATLDVGTGTGLSVPHYPAAVDELVLVEPSPHMREALQATVADDPPPVASIEIVDGDAYALPFDDDTFDTVSSSLLFCSLRRPDVTLAEMHRVLRPGGRLLFHEHVVGSGWRSVVQHVLSPLQARLADGCRPTQDFESVLARSPFDVVSIEHTRMPRGFVTIRPLVLGEARAHA
jgi:ubiquinone/menaquinone biosynthesis C-methylase UbiE